ncbi:hypothetical protein [Streptomyces enissocaesilis]|uniref:Uncharacterized protein n=1 Tax=Streptomyces enissocaesilis TaxID=332589 RepID=A0ABN3WSP8_9ACTN
MDPAAPKGPDDPLPESLDGCPDSALPSQWLPSPSGLPAVAGLRLLLSDGFAALGEHLAADGDRAPGWEQRPARSVPHPVEECAAVCGLDEDAAALHWKPVRFKAAAAELGGSGLVLRADRAGAGRSLFLPGTRQGRKPTRLPADASKPVLLPPAREHRSTTHPVAVPSGPLPLHFADAWEGRNG